jgi:hypothetical protein
MRIPTFLRLTGNPLLCGLVVHGLVLSACCSELGLAEVDLKLAWIQTFPSEANAARQCRPDTVVWVDASNGYYYTRLAPEYGTTPGGSFACMHAAVSADYWDRNPFSTLTDRGRSFPINPALRCRVCS